ncbi:MAG: NAD-dependent protein deacylase [Anaeroplasmataceae bacterium]
MKNIERLKKALDEASNIVIFTGAGISCPSPTNIPDFRSANGLYSELYGNIRPEEIISHSFFMKNPGLFYDFYGKKMVYRNALYNKAHKFFANLEKTKNVSVVTQNIDGLHQAAGSTKVYELHGSVWRNYCMRCHRFYSLDEISVTHVPYCECGGIIKPDVVLYEEGLNDEVVNNALNAISRADTMVIVGTSLNVYPAASFVRYFRGNSLILINKETTQYDDMADIVINDDIINVIEQLEKM